MLKGSKKRVRHGGRQKGTPNRATRERLLLAKRVLEEQQGKPGRKLAREVLDDFMHLCMGLAATYQPLPAGAASGTHQTPDHEKFERYARMAMDAAKDLAPYQSPKLKAVMVSIEPQPGSGVDANKDLTPGTAAQISKLTPSQVYRMFRDSDLIDIPTE